jgi:enoyl-CoA hydratase/carnithine racemase
MSLLAFQQHGQLGEIVLDNPPQNRFSAEALTDLGAAIAEAAKSDVRAVLLRAEGPDFSVGADVAVFDGVDEAKAAGLAGAVLGFISAMEDLSVPTVALVQGQCYDGALEMCLACDLIWAAEGSQFSQIETAAGGIPWAGGTQRLASRIGVARAAEMVFTASVVPAETLLAWGAINRVTPADRLLDEGRAFAQGLADGPTLAYKAIKRLLHASRSGGVAEADRLGVAEAPAVMVSDDLRDGIASLQKHGLGHATFHGR